MTRRFVHNRLQFIYNGFLIYNISCNDNLLLFHSKYGTSLDILFLLNLRNHSKNPKGFLNKLSPDVNLHFGNNPNYVFQFSLTMADILNINETIP